MIFTLTLNIIADNIQNNGCLEFYMEITRQKAGYVLSAQAKPNQKTAAVDKSTTTEQLQESQDSKLESQQGEYLLSKELDQEAATYKENNPTFKSDYEALEKAMQLVKAQSLALREQINKLKQHPIQRALNTNDADLSQTKPIAIKTYQDEATQEQIEVLEKQLAENQKQHAQLKVKMLTMIMDERKRLEELEMRR